MKLEAIGQNAFFKSRDGNVYKKKGAAPKGRFFVLIICTHSSGNIKAMMPAEEQVTSLNSTEVQSHKGHTGYVAS